MLPCSTRKTPLLILTDEQGRGKAILMKENVLDFLEQAEDTKNIKKIALFFVGVVILGVVGFCEVLYVAMILPAFPDGLVQGVAVVGACATGASAVLLLIGKLHWFSKGPQSVAAWIFVGAETLILILNVLLAVQLHNGHVDSWMGVWANFYPAAPIVAFVGWGVILFLDKTNKMRTMRRDQEDRQEKAELAYEHLAFQAQMRVKHESLKILEGKLAEKIRSAQNLAALDQVADQITDAILGQISGQHVTSIKPVEPPALPTPKQPPVQLTPAEQQQLLDLAKKLDLQQTPDTLPQTGPFALPTLNGQQSNGTTGQNGGGAK